MENIPFNKNLENQISDQLAREGGPKHKPTRPLESPVFVPSGVSS